MKLGFILFDYFPFGGLQRDCLRIARQCVERGHAVTVLVRTWAGEKPDGIGVEVLGRPGWTNAGRNRRFVRRVVGMPVRHGFDGVVGFNRMPGLDVYYGADPCYAAKVRRLKPAWYRWLPRVRYFEAMERAVYAKGQPTEVLLLKDTEIPLYEEFYGTERERVHVLPPGIVRPSFTAEQRSQIRERVRHEQGWVQQERVLLFVGSGFRIKGLDRAIDGLAALRKAGGRTRLAVIGQGAPSRFARQADRLGLTQRVHFLGGRDDVPELMTAADVLVHPAYSENTGTILLEAMTVGLPVLTTDVCGYAFHVVRARAGIVLSSPFRQETFNRELAAMLAGDRVPAWRESGLAYAAKEDLYSCDQRAAEIIEETIRRKRRVP